MSANRKFIAFIAFLFVFTFISIIWMDKPLASYIDRNLESLDGVLTPVVIYIETFFGFGISKYLFGFLAIAIGTAVYLKNRKSDVSRIFFFIGTTHIVTRLTAGVIKNFFLRPRPFEWLDGNNSGFFSEGSSFPSGHTAHFFGLFLPIAFLFPKFSWIIILPVFVATSRILDNDHYLSDITASIIIAVLFTWVFANVFKVPGSPLTEPR
jgi:membrane-associated phospholipid phosphatase